jgi:sterol desaturase/sphingolipid hydroxylase (fatty acid hydroxylase superfamily)
VILWYAALVNVLGNLNHSNIDMPMPGFVHYLFATPDVHRLHHEIDADLGRSNLSPGTMLPDLLFGTFRHPHDHRLENVGIEANPIPGKLLAQLAAPLIWPILVWRRRRLKPNPISG